MDGTICAGIYTKKAVKRFLSDIKKSEAGKLPYVYDTSYVDAVCAFTESLKPSDLNGETIRLLPWQVFCFANLEGWRHRNDRSRKRFRLAYIEVNRKNGKTTGLLYPLVLYNFIKYKSSESYIISSRDDLAEKTFKEVGDIIHSDDEMEKLLLCRSGAITFRDSHEKSRLGFFCDGGKDADGFRPRFFCIDEYHAFESDKMFTSMQYGMRSKKDAQGVIITTADTDIARPCYEQNLKAKRILNGIQDQDDFFTIIYALDEGDDIHDELNWQKANPSLYDIIDPSVIQTDIDDAELTPYKLPELKAKTFGLWGGGGERSWMPVDVWQKNKDAEVDDKEIEGLECWCGLDLAQVDDFSVFTKVFRVNGKNVYRHRMYIPEDTVHDRYRKENANILSWCEQGIITVIPGSTIDYTFIADDIVKDAERYHIRAIGYDRWQARDVINAIDNARPDIQLIEIEQSLKKMAPITKAYEKQVKDGLLVDNNPVMLWMMSNVEIKPDVNNNYKPMKRSRSSTGHIDGIISAIMAHSLMEMKAGEDSPPAMSFEELMALI